MREAKGTSEPCGVSDIGKGLDIFFKGVSRKKKGTLLMFGDDVRITFFAVEFRR